MLIRCGYEIRLECQQPTALVCLMSIEDARTPDIRVPETLDTSPAVPTALYRDLFGNRCRRLVAPSGAFTIRSDATVADSGRTDRIRHGAREMPVEDLPDDCLVFLMGSRYCETDHLSQTAWDLFGSLQPGWQRVQAICDFVHQHVTFGYEFARPTKTAADTYKEKTGVCRDFTHLAVAFCRCMNIPARYCAGYLPNINDQLPQADPDFAAWFEAYLDGQWYVFDPRNNLHLQGRILIAQGRDATDVAISNAFGDNSLTKFELHSAQVD